jgi:hypothetical protein
MFSDSLQLFKVTRLEGVRSLSGARASFVFFGSGLSLFSIFLFPWSSTAVSFAFFHAAFSLSPPFFAAAFTRLEGVRSLSGARASFVFFGSGLSLFSGAGPCLFDLSLLCFLLTAGTFVITNLEKSLYLYERYHPIGLHIIPGDL